MVSFNTIFALTGLFATAFALPSDIAARQAALLCGSGTPQCCSVDVLGVANLNCRNPPTLPTDIPNFNDICAEVGQQDMCCLLPILGQALLCQSPSPA